MPITYIDTIDNLKGSKILSRYDGGLNTTDSNEILQDNEAIMPGAESSFYLD